jgi:ABC-type sugar transport system substrate-binding protein
VRPNKQRKEAAKLMETVLQDNPKKIQIIVKPSDQEASGIVRELCAEKKQSSSR